jgi:hypothetical protein
VQEKQANSVAVLDTDDGAGRPEDAFRRATFHWAQSTKKMVDMAAALGPNTRVAHAALADVEYARGLLDSLYLPPTVKTPAAYADGRGPVTAAEVHTSVSNLATRIGTMPCCDNGAHNSALQAHVDDIVGAPPIVRHHQVRKTPFNARVERRGVDLSAPVYSSGGKMLWAGVDCPACPSKASQRCQKDDGGFIEKPHKERKALAEQPQNA